ncbi:hypothetical protein EDB85DRAFT_1889818 [Lactarius pseudohatsudake]|nr:hypothetical protein EDB85DRAFT_1889818 [Lactarius pseudohatsudake]
MTYYCLRGSHSRLHYLDTGDAKSTSNLQCHANICWGKETVHAASQMKYVYATCDAMAKAKPWDGLITAVFEWIGKNPILLNPFQLRDNIFSLYQPLIAIPSGQMTRLTELQVDLETPIPEWSTVNNLRQAQLDDNIQAMIHFGWVMVNLLPKYIASCVHEIQGLNTSHKRQGDALKGLQSILP